MAGIKKSVAAFEENPANSHESRSQLNQEVT
jgi:hypothetical protein